MDMSRRTVLASGSALALAAGLPTAAFAFPAWEARSGMSGTDYQAKFDQMAAQGFRLLAVDGYTVSGSTNFAAIWMKRPGPAWVARHNMTAGQYQQAFDTFTAQGYRPVWITSYFGPGGQLFAAIFDKSGGADWQARHAMTQAAFQQTFDQLTAQGYRLTCTTVCGLVTNGYSGLFEKSGSAFMSYAAMTPGDYQQKFDALGAQGYRLRQVKGYSTIVGPRFAAIWDKSGGPAWEAHHNLTTAQFQQTFDSLTSNGFWLSDVTGYDNGGQTNYAGIFQKA